MRYRRLNWIDNACESLLFSSEADSKTQEMLKFQLTAFFLVLLLGEVTPRPIGSENINTAIKVCLRNSSKKTYDRDSCITCVPCATSQQGNWLLAKCANAYIDCSYWCSASFHWDNDVLDQTYLDTFQSACHISVPVLLGKKETTTSPKTNTGTIRFTGPANVTRPAELFDLDTGLIEQPLVIGGICIAVIVMSVLILVGIHYWKKNSAGSSEHTSSGQEDSDYSEHNGQTPTDMIEEINEDNVESDTINPASGINVDVKGNNNIVIMPRGNNASDMDDLWNRPPDTSCRYGDPEQKGQYVRLPTDLPCERETRL